MWWPSARVALEKCKWFSKSDAARGVLLHNVGANKSEVRSITRYFAQVTDIRQDRSKKGLPLRVCENMLETGYSARYFTNLRNDGDRLEDRHIVEVITEWLRLVAQVQDKEDQFGI